MYQIKHREQIFKLPKLDNITICGYSISAYRTGYLILPYKIYLDAGLPSPIPPNLILLSHGHNDHIASLYSLLVEGNKTQVLLPKNMTNNVQQLLNNYSSLNSGKKIKYNNWQPINATTFQTTISNNEFNINTFILDHSVDCVGYSIDKNSKKLKNEYINHSGEDLKKLKKITNIYDDLVVPVLLFISDTGKSILSTLPFNKYSLVIIECTFFAEEHYEEAVLRKHLHWNDLEPIIKLNSSTKFILGHFSSRYSIDFLKEKEKILYNKYSNIIFWI